MSGNRIRGWDRANLLVDIAKGEKTLQEIADGRGVTIQAIYAFRERNAAVIERVKEQVADGTLNEVSGLWIADKANRISMYERQVEALEEQIESGDLEPKDVRGHFAGIRAGLHAVAEELGALPQRVQVEHSGKTEVSYNIVGVDPKDLT